MICSRILPTILMVGLLAPVAAADPFGEAPWRDPVAIPPRGGPHGFVVCPGLPSGGRVARYRPISTESAQETWLGVQLSPIPGALAAHLKLDGGAVMVRNVFRDSPADKAGLERYDVIVNVDGKPVEAGVEGFSKHVRDKEPGDALELKIYHEGQEKSLKIELQRRPADWGEMALKYEDDPDVAHSRKFGLSGKILRPGPDGWELKDLGEIPELLDLYRNLEPGVRSFLGREGVDEGRRVDKQGGVLHVRRQKDGTIVVKRYASKDGEDQADVKIYQDMDELRKADPEAYELLRSTRGPKLPRFGWQREDQPGPAPDDLWKPRWTDPDLREWGRRFFQGPLEDLKESESFRRFFKPAPEPTTRFEVGPDGAITVHVRKDDAELSMTFESKDALEKKAPELYKQFAALEKEVR